MFNKDKIKEDFKIKYGYEPTNDELIHFINDNKELYEIEHKKASNYEKVASILFFIWFIFSFVSLLTFSELDKDGELMLVFAQYFFVFFFLFVCGQKNFIVMSIVTILAFIFVGSLWFDIKIISFSMSSGESTVAGIGLVLLLIGISLFLKATKDGITKKGSDGVTEVVNTTSPLLVVASVPFILIGIICIIVSLGIIEF